MMRAVLLIISVFLVGCVHTYEMNSGGAGTPQARVSKGAAFFVGVSENGRLQDRIYYDSGEMLTRAIVEALERHGAKVRAAKDPATVEENLANARSKSAQYLIQPTIVHWEDRATEWSGKPDRVLIRLALLGVATGKTLDSTELSANSKWATFGGDHPQELLPELLRQYTDTIFASPTK